MFQYNQHRESRFEFTDLSEFADYLAINNTSNWVDIIHTQDIKTLLPNHQKLIEFFDRLGETNSIIFLNSLGSHFNTLFPKNNDFPDLLTMHNAASKAEWVLTYVHYIRDLEQLVPLFKTVEAKVRLKFIRELGDNIHHLNDQSSANTVIEQMLKPSIEEFMVWKYYKENHVITFNNRFKDLPDLDARVDASLRSIVRARYLKISWLFWNDPGADAAKRLQVAFLDQTMSRQKQTQILSKELTQLEHHDLSASMGLAYCLERINDLRRLRRDTQSVIDSDAGCDLPALTVDQIKWLQRLQVPSPLTTLNLEKLQKKFK